MKDFYSLMSNALKIYMADNGCSDLYCAGWKGSFSEYSTPNGGPRVEGSLIPVVREFLNDYIKTTKQKIVLVGPDYSVGNYKGLDGGSTGWWFGNYDIVCETGYCFWLPNGARVGFPTNGSTGCNNTLNDKDVCTLLNVDLNGEKKGPNRTGYDIFLFAVRKDGTITGKSGECAAPSETSGRRYGEGCAARVIKNGWKIDYWD